MQSGRPEELRFGELFVVSHKGRYGTLSVCLNDFGLSRLRHNAIIALSIKWVFAVCLTA